MQLAWLFDSWKESYCLNLIWGYLYSALPLNTFFIGVALPTKKKKGSPLLHGSIGFFLFQHETPTPAAFWKKVQCCNVCVLVTWKQGKQGLTRSTSFTGRYFFLMRDLKAVGIWFSPQQMTCVINCIQLLLPPLKSEQLRKRKKSRSYHNQPQLYNRHISLQS